MPSGATSESVGRLLNKSTLGVLAVDLAADPAVIIGAAFIVLHRTGRLGFADLLPTVHTRGTEEAELPRLGT